MEEVRKHNVYDKVPIKECWETSGNEPVGAIWVDINTGDEENPECRSRRVTQYIPNSKRDDLFAATPPLEALNILLSVLTSTRK